LDETPIPTPDREPVKLGPLPEEGYRLRPHYVVAIGMLVMFIVIAALAQAGALTFFSTHG
jgi:hypothetical protein